MEETRIEDTVSWIGIVKLLLSLCKNDKVLQGIFIVSSWIVVLAFIQIVAFRIIQVHLFEVPIESYFLPIKVIDIFYFVISVPLPIVFLPLALYPLKLIYEAAEKVSSILEKKSKCISWINLIYKPFIVMFIPSLLWFIIWKFIEKNLEVSAELMAGTLFYGQVVVFLHLLFKALSENNQKEESKKVTIGVFVVVILFILFLGICSIFTFSDGLTKSSYRINYLAPICAKLSLVSIFANDNHKIGWLLNKNENAIIIREKKEGVYRTIEIPKEHVRQIDYLERFGSGKERGYAFPGCFNIFKQ